MAERSREFSETTGQQLMRTNLPPRQESHETAERTNDRALRLHSILGNKRQAVHSIEELRALATCSILRSPPEELQSAVCAVATQFSQSLRKSQLSEVAASLCVDGSHQVLAKLHADQRLLCKTVASFADQPVTPRSEQSLLIATLSSLTPRQRGEFIVEALGMEGLKEKDVARYERGVNAVMRLSADPIAAAAYLERLRPGISKTIATRHDSADLLLQTIVASDVAPSAVRSTALGLQLQSSLITNQLRGAIAGAIAVELEFALRGTLQGQTRTQSVNENPELTAVQLKSEAKGEAKGAPQRSDSPSTILLLLDESKRGNEVDIAKELVRIGFALLAEARAHEKQREKNLVTAETIRVEQIKSVTESLIRLLDPTRFGALIESFRQEDYLAPLPFRLEPAARAQQAKTAAA